MRGGERGFGMKNEYLVNECDKIFDFWKLEEYFTPSDYPELTKIVKRNKKEFPFDTYCNGYGARNLPLNEYKEHNEYLIQKKVPAGQLYNRANVYQGCYKVRTFVEKMAECCGLDMEKYAEISEISDRFYIFSVQIDLEGNITEEGVQISPFFYAVLSMIKAKGISVNIVQEDIWRLNEDINEILNQNSTVILRFEDVEIIKKILFSKLGVRTDEEIGLEGVTTTTYACKGLRSEEESSEFCSFYLSEIERVQKDCRNNKRIIRYTTSLCQDNKQEIMIDSDIDVMKNWLSVDKFPMAKYPSKFAPTLMQQIAINIATSEKESSEKVFSVNGPPGTGKTTLLKEIIASNVVQLAEVLIKFGIDSEKFVPKKVESASSSSYIEKYYTIPNEIAQFGILVVSNNNGAVENITLDLPKADGLRKEKTRTGHFDRTEFSEIYFSAVADKLLDEVGSAWGLISARMGKKKYVSKVLDSCVFAKKNDDTDKVTLDSAREESISWKEAIDKFRIAQTKVLLLREEIKKDQTVLVNFYEEKESLSRAEMELNDLRIKREQLVTELGEVQGELDNNEKETRAIEDEIKYVIKHASIIGKVFIFFRIGKIGKQIKDKKNIIEELVIRHGDIKQRCRQIERDVENNIVKITEQRNQVCARKESVENLKEKIYGSKNSLKEKYGINLADNEFYVNIKESEESQNACPWTFDEYDEAREELFFAALQVRKAFILESQYVRRNLFVYGTYHSGKYTMTERKEMFPHLFNALAIVIPVLSSTFASVGRFLKYAGNMSLGMLVIDEAGQAIPQSALGALYRTKSAVVVGDPLQVEPVVTIPQVLIDILADSTGVPSEYKVVENSAQTFADNMNEFNGLIGERQVGCPLVVHRRCIEPMFSISNMISYDNRMFNETLNKEVYLEEDQPFLIKKSGWINVDGPERGGKNHFVENQAIKVCQLIEKALDIYNDLFVSDKKIFIITPFRTVAEGMRKFVCKHFVELGFDKEMMTEWSTDCIGTVHTFQGKEAKEVLFVLGCSNQSVRAMNWVVKKANILNVACTRAKYRIAFIGNIDDWKTRRYFKEFIPELIDIIDA